MSAAYSRDTELRNVQPNDLYQLAVILDDDDYWKKLMEAIPKDINNQSFSTTSNSPSEYSAAAPNGRKYSNDHIRLVQNACKRSGESRLCPQILFDEWGSSGRKHERPTLGVLLHLLLKAHLFRAADYVAETLLRESKPSRPTEGPGAEITCDLPSSIFADIHEMANDSRNYPDTELLQQNANFGSSMMDNNKDYYTKYRDPIEKHLASLLMSANDNGGVPKPPPRLQRSTRFLMKQQQNHTQSLLQQVEKSQQTADIINHHDIFTINEHEQPSHNEDTPLATSDNLPKISLLMNSTNTGRESVDESSLANDDSTPNLSFLIGISQASENMYSSNSTPNFDFTNNVESDQLINGIGGDEQHSHDLPVISALNLNGERDNTSQQFSNIDENVPSVASHFYAKNSASCSSDTHFNIPCVVEAKACEEQQSEVDDIGDCSTVNKVKEYDINDEDDDDEIDDDDVPNLSIFNDSSLTSVTNTSGDNSFEQSVNDSRPSSASAENVPTLNAL